MKILIIDDNPAVRATLKIVLGNEFGEVVAAGDPRLIPALLGSGTLDAVVLDMNFDSSRLDGSDGLFWLERIKAAGDAPAVVLITAFGDVPLAVEAMKLGAEDFITKPWDNDILIEKLHKAIEINRQAKSAARSVDNAREIERRDSIRSRMTLSELKLEHIRHVIGQCGGNLSAAAGQLGINRQTLYNMLKKI